MKTAKRDKPATNEPFEKFKRFATALMAVPKKELDKELAKHEGEKLESKTHKSKSRG